MMTNIKKIFAAGLVCSSMFSMAVGLTACSDNDEEAQLKEAILVREVALNLPDNIAQLLYTDDTDATVLPLIKGESVTLPYTISPAGTTFTEVVWSSSNPSCATVDAAGKVTAVSGGGLGYSIVTVMPKGYASGGGVYSSLKVKVSDQLVPASSVNVTVSGTEVYAGETVQATAEILPAEATYRTVKWTSSNEAAATVDKNGVVTGHTTSAIYTPVTITATTLDGSNIIGSVDIVVKQIVQPESITIDQVFSADNGYSCAINEKTLELTYQTSPADCTTSLIEWSSSDESIATVANGVVTFNNSGNFGDVTITALCPATGNSSSVKLNLAAGLMRELFHNEKNLLWNKDNGQKSTQEWHDGYLTIYTATGTKQRGDILTGKVWLHAGNYPVLVFRIDDLMDRSDVTARNITLDGSGSDFKGGLNGNNNKWAKKYKCSDGSSLLVYDLSTQKWATGGLLPTNEAVAFNKLTLKYADIAGATEQLHYNVYWVQTFKTEADALKYVTAEGLTYE